MPELDALAARILLAAFFLSFLFGAIVQKTHFCTMGAIGDLLAMGDSARLRQWALAAGVAIIGFWALVAAGQIDPAATLYSGARWLWLSSLVGGFLFGFGMVLGSGCGSKTLVRLGAGNLKSVVVLMALGLAAFATLKGITGVLRVATVDRVAVDFDQPALLPLGLAGATGWTTGAAGLLAALVLGGGLMLWALLGRGFRTADNLLAGFGIGALVVAMWWVSGHLGFLAEHPQTLEAAYIATYSGRAEALTFVGPVAHTLEWLLFFSDANRHLTLGVASVFGVVAGSAVTALVRREFRWEGFRDIEDLARHLVGGLLMGVGGVTAVGCTIGQGLSGISTLSATSFTAVAGILAGGVAGFKYQNWRLERMA